MDKSDPETDKKRKNESNINVVNGICTFETVKPGPSTSNGGKEMEVNAKKARIVIDSDDDDIEVLDHVIKTDNNVRISMKNFDPKLMKDVSDPKFKLKPTTFVNDRMLEINDFSQGKEQYNVSVWNYGGTRPLDLNFTYLYKPVIDKEAHKKQMEKLIKKGCKRQNVFHPSGCNCEPGQCGTDKCSCRRRSIMKLKNGKVPDVEAVRICEPVQEVLECRKGVCGCSARCQNVLTKPGMQFRTEIRNLEWKGYGVFALEYIPKGSYFGEYLGEVVYDQGTRIEGSFMYKVEGVRGKEYFEYLIDARYYGNLSSYMNHACNNNMAPMYFVRDESYSILFPQLGFIAIEDILPGEEITLNYGRAYFELYNKKCYCYYSKCEFGMFRSAEEVQEAIENEKRTAKEREAKAEEYRKIAEQKRQELLTPVTID
ncbi:unnamed protein product [Bursaphelenchus okinawaensis]|uniref:SET domain-containing protein n=1 Tax=Bursaphelenchus okinawaensis TaxID=465554 RepID=A0A811L830_9BILA|nr:unnamed protein product [Bursaphelenchus okinawaensis]CAG9117468.1 unnamed protein product [Bursaphelenchus okinawaensis]